MYILRKQIHYTNAASASRLGKSENLQRLKVRSLQTIHPSVVRQRNEYASLVARGVTYLSTYFYKFREFNNRRNYQKSLAYIELRTTTTPTLTRIAYSTPRGVHTRSAQNKSETNF